MRPKPAPARRPIRRRARCRAPGRCCSTWCLPPSRSGCCAARSARSFPAKRATWKRRQPVPARDQPRERRARRLTAFDPRHSTPRNARRNVYEKHRWPRPSPRPGPRCCSSPRRMADLRHGPHLRRTTTSSSMLVHAGVGVLFAALLMASRTARRRHRRGAAVHRASGERPGGGVDLAAQGGGGGLALLLRGAPAARSRRGRGPWLSLLLGPRWHCSPRRPRSSPRRPMAAALRWIDAARRDASGCRSLSRLVVVPDHVESRGNPASASSSVPEGDDEPWVRWRDAWRRRRSAGDVRELV